MNAVVEHRMHYIPFRLKDDGSNIKELFALAEGNMVLTTEGIDLQIRTPGDKTKPLLGHLILLKDPSEPERYRCQVDPLYPNSEGFSRVFVDTIITAVSHAASLRSLVRLHDGKMMNLVVVDNESSNVMFRLQQMGFAPLVIPPELNISMIVGTDRRRAIGGGNSIPWKHKGDMRFFRETTISHIVLMGRKTFESMKSKPLKHRHNIVLSSTLTPVSDEATDFSSGTTLQFAATMQDAIDLAEATRSHVESTTGHSPTLFIIGGGQIYGEFLPYTQTIFHNVIDLDAHGVDAYFPALSMLNWTMTKDERHRESEVDGLMWNERTFERR